MEEMSFFRRQKASIIFKLHMTAPPGPANCQIEFIERLDLQAPAKLEVS